MNKRDMENFFRFRSSLLNQPTEQDYFAVNGDTNALHRLNTRLRTLSERLCNGDGWHRDGSTCYSKWDDTDEAKFSRLWDNTMAKVKAIFARYGITEVQERGDPRGWDMFEAKAKDGTTFRVSW